MKSKKSVYRQVILVRKATTAGWYEVKSTGPLPEGSTGQSVSFECWHMLTQQPRCSGFKDFSRTPGFLYFYIKPPNFQRLVTCYKTNKQN